MKKSLSGEVMNMALTKITAENFTVFENITIPFTNGLNVLVGENGMGKLFSGEVYRGKAQRG